MIILEAKRHFRERAMEWWSAGLMVLWGGYVMLHPSMFSEIAACRGLLILAPQHIWGFFSFLFGMSRLFALTVNGFWYRTPLIRLVTSFFGIFVWFWITVGLVLSNLPQMGVVVYGWMMAADMYSVFRSASDTYEAEAQRRLKSLSYSEKSTQEIGANVTRLRS